MKPAIRHAFAATGAMLLLTACGGGGPEDTAPTEAAASVERLVGENARVVLPAVSGNPAVAYFDLTYNSGGGPTVTSVSVEGASMSEIHAMEEVDGMMTMGKAAPIALLGRIPVKFEPGGYHVMAMQPSADLEPGGTTSITVTLSTGEETTFPAEVRAPGEER